MKPFDLEQAKAGSALVTREGKKATFVAHVPECSEEYRVVARVEGDDSVESFYESGSYYSEKGHCLDLFMAPTKRTMYVQIYDVRGDSPIEGGKRAYAFPTKEEAEKNARTTSWGVLAVAVPIEIEA